MKGGGKRRAIRIGLAGERKKKGDEIYISTKLSYFGKKSEKRDQKMLKWKEREERSSEEMSIDEGRGRGLPRLAILSGGRGLRGTSS